MNYIPIYDDSGTITGYRSEDGESKISTDDYGQMQFTDWLQGLRDQNIVAPSIDGWTDSNAQWFNSTGQYTGAPTGNAMLEYFNPGGTWGSSINPLTGESVQTYQATGAVNPRPYSDFGTSDWDEFMEWAGLLGAGMGAGTFLTGTGPLSGLFGGGTYEGAMNDFLSSGGGGGSAIGGGAGALNPYNISGDFLSGLQSAGGAIPTGSSSLGGGLAGLDGLGGTTGGLFNSGGIPTSGGGMDSYEIPDDGLGTYEVADEALGGSSLSSILDFLRGNSSWLTPLLGAGVQGLSSWLGASAQRDAANQANQTLWNMYSQNRADLAPWREAGVGALNQLVNLTTPGKQLDTMMLDPGYQFRYDTGMKELDDRLRAAGKFYSGDALKGGQEYAQNYATNEFGNVYNRLAGLAGTGQTATAQTGAFGQNAAQGMAGNQIGAGNARASGYTGIGNAVQGGINNYQNNQLLNLLLPRLMG